MALNVHGGAAVYLVCGLALQLLLVGAAPTGQSPSPASHVASGQTDVINQLLTDVTAESSNNEENDSTHHGIVSSAGESRRARLWNWCAITLICARYSLAGRYQHPQQQAERSSACVGQHQDQQELIG